MSAWYELGQNAKGQFSFVLKSGNGQVILCGEQYGTKGAAENGVASTQKNCAADGRYERKEAKDGRFYFTLKAANHQVIGTSQMYAGAAARDAGIESVKACGATTAVKPAT